MQPNNLSPEQSSASPEAHRSIDLERNVPAAADMAPTPTPLPAETRSEAVPQAPVAPPPSPLESLTQIPDVDEISDVWVNRAETIIETQQNDPRLEEEQSAALSRDYLKQKFGLDVDKT